MVQHLFSPLCQWRARTREQTAGESDELLIDTVGIEDFLAHRTAFTMTVREALHDTIARTCLLASWPEWGQDTDDLAGVPHGSTACELRDDNLVIFLPDELSIGTFQYVITLIEKAFDKELRRFQDM